MKGISYITDLHQKKTAVIIDLKNIKTNGEEIHDLIDVLVVESREKDELVDWETAKKQLKRKGKL